MNIGTGGFQEHSTKARLYCKCLIREISRWNRSHALFRKHQTEAAAESCEVVVLKSGAWKTWVMSDLLYEKLLMCL